MMEIPWVKVEGRYLFHPYLVHFPIALFVLEAFLVFLWIVRRDEKYENFSFFVFKTAVLTFPFVMLAGYWDAGGLVPRVRTHFILAATFFIFNSVRLSIRWKMGPQLWRGGWRVIYPALVLISVLLTILTAHFGGKLVYF